ncbi:MAG: FAD-dependent thymidylate synthase [Patescibacteria group bacterium]|nr:FAD-dependent thymidylate synthase [Patescibacteria group bacterium]
MENIFIYDEFSPEDTAMMQALYSRSPKSAEEHADKVKKSGSGKFMKKFYVGYGHQSIADCGSTTIFIEKVSILADKAIQDWPLYSGQETSTRYIDMSKQPIIDPINESQSKQILARWMKFYTKNQNKVKDHIANIYPRKKHEDEKMYNKAIEARTFDIMRAFLPAGITTQLSWHTNLRQAYDKLSLLKYGPLDETKKIANKILKKLKKKYPNSFSHKVYEEQEKYREHSSKNFFYYYPKTKTDFSCSTNIESDKLTKYEKLLTSRPIKTNLPHFLAELGLISFDFILDFGSFRDIQRHRNGICRMPLLTTNLKFNNWYLEQLPFDARIEAKKMIKKQIIEINNLNTSDEIKQYYIAMGFNVQCRTTYGLPSAVYVTELRSGKLVHPTLRKIAHQMHFALEKKFPILKLHSDLEKDDWDIRRGTQDIIKK